MLLEKRTLGVVVLVLLSMSPSPAGELAKGKKEPGPFGDVPSAAETARPDGKLLAIAAADRDPSAREPFTETVHLYDLAARKLVHKFRSQRGAPAFLGYSSDGEFIVTSDTWDQPVQLWSARTGAEVRSLKGHEERCHWAEHRPSAFSPDASLLAIAGKENAIVLFELATGQEVHRLPGHKGPVRALAFGPDSRSLLSGSADTMGLIWDLAPLGNRTKMAAADLDRVWKQLAANDAPAAYRAQWRLIGAPADAVPMLKQRLKATPAPDLERIPKLISDLDSASFTVRDAASRSLRDLGGVADDAIRKALAEAPGLETRRRLEELLAALQGWPIPPEELQRGRAIQVLERIGSPPAGQVLEVLARGAPTVRTTRAAEAALRRLSARSAPAVVPAPEAPRSKPIEASKAGTLSAAKAEVTALAFTKDASTLAAASTDGTVRLWNPHTRALVKEFKADANAVFAVVFSPDGQRLASAGQDRVIHLWDWNAGRQIHAFKGHHDTVACLAFTPNGKLLASGSLDKTIILWNPDSAQHVRTLSGHQGGVTSISMSPDGKRLASGDRIVGNLTVNGKAIDNHWSAAARIWDVARGAEVRSIAQGGQIVAFSPDGDVVATAELETELYVGGVQSSRSTGTTITTGSAERPVIKGHANIHLWQVATGQSRLHLEGKGVAVAFSPDGRFLATARGSDLHLGGNIFDTSSAPAGDGRLRVWEVATGQEVLAFPAGATPTVLAFSPDGRSLATGMKNGTVDLWDLAPRGDSTADDLDHLWTMLAGADAAGAYRASWALRSAGAKALPDLDKRLRPLPATDPALQRLITELNDGKFQMREAAYKELERRGADAEAAICLGLQQTPSSNVRMRLLALLASPGIVQHTEPLRRARAIGVLEAIGSEQAREILQMLARESPLARQTQEAKAALDRMNKAAAKSR